MVKMSPDLRRRKVYPTTLNLRDLPGDVYRFEIMEGFKSRIREKCTIEKEIDWPRPGQLTVVTEHRG